MGTYAVLQQHSSDIALNALLETSRAFIAETGRTEPPLSSPSVRLSIDHTWTDNQTSSSSPTGIIAYGRVANALLQRIATAQHLIIHSSLFLTPQAFLSTSLHLFTPALAFVTPSANPIFFAKLAASSYFFLASPILPSISKNSPRLCVATAQPMSHSSFRSDPLI